VAPLEVVQLTTWPSAVQLTDYIQSPQALARGLTLSRVLDALESARLTGDVAGFLAALWRNIRFELPPEPTEAFEDITGQDVPDATTETWSYRPY
jgi:hypothetical protein